MTLVGKGRDEAMPAWGWARGIPPFGGSPRMDGAAREAVARCARDDDGNFIRPPRLQTRNDRRRTEKVLGRYSGDEPKWPAGQCRYPGGCGRRDTTACTTSGHHAGPHRPPPPPVRLKQARDLGSGYAGECVFGSVWRRARSGSFRFDAGKPEQVIRDTAQHLSAVGGPTLLRETGVQR